MNKIVPISLICTLAAIPFPVIAAESISDALANGDPSLELRYRYEGVDQDGLSEDAMANTLRTRLGYTSGSYNDFSVTLEFDNVAYIGDEDFNSLRNGETAYPVVADPEGTDLNQSFVTWSGAEGVQAKLGRQRINLNNQRFVGGVGWRQNEQTYDAASVSYSKDAFSAFYAYVDNVNRIFGPVDGAPAADLNSDSHMLNLGYKVSDSLSLGGYLLSLDFEDALALSNETTGLFVEGKFKDLQTSPFFRAEFATQTESKDKAADYDADYSLFELGGSLAGVTLMAGLETLGADKDAGIAFQTPLATAHKFQGWADKFLATPASGVVDTYATAKYAINGFNMAVTYHEFESDVNSLDYGDELDAVVSKKFAGRYLVMLKYADYSADTLATDTSKTWLMVNASF